MNRLLFDILYNAFSKCSESPPKKNVGETLRNRSVFKFLLIIIFLSNFCFAQEKIQLKYSDKLTGRTENGQTIREATGNVKLIHGNVTVFCNTAIQNIDANKVELKGDVKIFQDTVSLFTSKATYFGNESKAICEGGVTLKDPNATVKANNGTYFFNETKAIFNGDVIVVNPTYRITSDKLTYFRNTEDSFARDNVIVRTDSSIIKADNIDFYKRQGKSYAFNNVNIERDSSIITSDTATDFSFEKKSIASGNVKMKNLRNNVIVTGNYLENYENTKYSIIKGNARLVQVEKGKDTMYIYSNVMESFRNLPEHYVAKDSVDVIRNDFFSKSGLAVYSKTNIENEDKLSLFISPIVWQDNIQMTGDTIFADLKEKKLQKIYAKKIDELSGSKYSFMIIQNKDANFWDRYDQVTGKDITIYFVEDKVNHVEVNKKANSLYFMYDDKKANGVNIADGMNMIITFDNEQRVDKVRIENKPKGQYVPENKLTTVTLTLPGFILRKDKPVRREK